ncbi:hypothetical protein OROMI_007217 [Orobanche minor]
MAMHTLGLTPPDPNWYMDTGATSHMSSASDYDIFDLGLPTAVLSDWAQTSSPNSLQPGLQTQAAPRLGQPTGGPTQAQTQQPLVYTRRPRVPPGFGPLSNSSTQAQNSSSPILVNLHRPLGLPENKGCRILVIDGPNTVEINGSYVFPIRIIYSEMMCLPLDDIEWGEKHKTFDQKFPAAIELLSHRDCQELAIDGRIAFSLEVGDHLPENNVSVIRPNSFFSGNGCKRLEEKFIVRDNLEMSLNITKCRASDDDVGFSEAFVVYIIYFSIEHGEIQYFLAFSSYYRLTFSS